jgi:hypothetical protein
MITPIHSVQPVDVREASHPRAEPKPDPHAQTPPVPKSGALSRDQVTLRSAGEADHDADRK